MKLKPWQLALLAAGFIAALAGSAQVVVVVGIVAVVSAGVERLRRRVRAIRGRLASASVILVDDPAHAEPIEWLDRLWGPRAMLERGASAVLVDQLVLPNTVLVVWNPRPGVAEAAFRLEDRYGASVSCLSLVYAGHETRAPAAEAGRPGHVLGVPADHSGARAWLLGLGLKTPTPWPYEPAQDGMPLAAAVGSILRDCPVVRPGAAAELAALPHVSPIVPAPAALIPELLAQGGRTLYLSRPPRDTYDPIWPPMEEDMVVVTAAYVGLSVEQVLLVARLVDGIAPPTAPYRTVLFGADILVLPAGVDVEGAKVSTIVWIGERALCLDIELAILRTATVSPWLPETLEVSAAHQASLDRLEGIGALIVAAVTGRGRFTFTDGRIELRAPAGEQTVVVDLTTTHVLGVRWTFE